MKTTDFYISLSLLWILIFFLPAFGDSNHSYGVKRADNSPDPLGLYMLVHTLDGDLILVERRTGNVKWSKNLGPVLLASYEGGPVIIADPLDGRLYEYSDEVSADILRYLDHSIMGYIRRSPTYYKHFISFGSKSDFWMSVDLNTGQLYQSASQDFVLQCPGQLNSSENVVNEGNKNGVPDLIGIGRTQYNLLFRDTVTGIARLNITYTTLAIHADPDVQNLGLRHMATTQPGLLTFEGTKLLWYLPLSTPVVGLYAVWSPPQPNRSPECDDASLPENHVPSMNHAEEVNTSAVNDLPVSSNSTKSSNTTKIPSTPSIMPRILRRIAFTTYALDVPKDPESLSSIDDAVVGRLESKFNGSLELAPSLLVGSSLFAPLYAITCVAESTLKLRGIRRASELFMIEGPILLPGHESTNQANSNGLLAGLIGLYELPTHSKPWSWDYPPSDAQYPQLTGPDWHDPRVLPPHHPEIPAIKGDESGQIPWHDVYLISATVFTLVCLICAWYAIRGHRWFSYFTSDNGNSAAQDFSFLPSHFDTPDSSGWAGCTAEEAGQPEAIRINLNEVLGHGANGTMVFAGMFGTHQTAVKRIVRQPQLEKHWRREHAILLRHHHPHLVRCYWTGSTANFHYLVMQRCETTLSELLRHNATERGFDIWGLTPCGVIHQVLQAVVCLHQNHIVHRDLKPSNVLIARNEVAGQARVVVGDFGLSRPMPTGRTDWTNSFGPHLLASARAGNPNRTGRTPLPGSSVAYGTGVNPGSLAPMDTASDLTSVGVTFGTLGWMAPELCDPQSGHLTYAIDIFACGLLAYHVLTGGGHPYDQSGLSDSEQPSLKADTGSSGSCSRNPTGNASTEASRPGSGSTENNQAPFCYSTATRLNRHHARQLAIAENRTPTLHRLTESASLVDVAKGFLGRQLIQSMLSYDPEDRPTAEEVIYYPLFWPASKIIRFISELSDVLDTRDDETALSGLLNCKSRPVTNRYFKERRALLDSLDSFASCVFNQHWFYRLEPELVQDLLRTRGYQDTSLMDLLRAIRNKHNHLWHLPERVRLLLGNTQEGMAAFWTSRFPTLVPLLYGLCRHHLTGFCGLVEFLPPQPPKSDFVVSDWWRLNCPLLAHFPAPSDRGLDAILKENGPRSVPYSSLNYSSRSMHRSDFFDSWKRGQVVPVSTSSVNNSPPRTVNNSLSQSETTAVEDTETCTCVEVLDQAAEDNSEVAETDEGVVKRRRRRPNQSKKIRPPKRERKAARAREELLARAGCELLATVNSQNNYAEDS